jgi:hypothetical protein
MAQAAQCDWWRLLGRAADILTLVGVPALALSYWHMARKLLVRRVIQTRVLPIERRFKGLICLVSAPFPASTNPAESPEAIGELIRTNDAPTEELLDRRIGSTLKAIQHHLGVLTHCWLVGSKDSTPYIELIEAACKKYFPSVLLLRPVIVDDVYNKVDDSLKAVHEIFERCGQQTHGQIHTPDLVTDITGGNKIMSIGASLACIDRDRSMEYLEQGDRKTFHEIDVTLEKILQRGKKIGRW